MYRIITLIFAASLAACKTETTCPENYTGAKCDQEVTPGRVRIQRIQFTSYPGTNDNQPWDQQSQWADPYIQIWSNNSPAFESIYLNEMAPVSICQWDTDIILLPEDSHVIMFFDEDGAMDTYIDGTVLQPYQAGEGFPERRTFFGNNGSQISIWVEYEY